MADKDENVMKEFSRELLAFQTACGIKDAEFAGMLLGAAGTMCHQAKIPLEHMLVIAKDCYNKGGANDNG